MAVGDEQFVAPARGVGPGLRTVKHHGPLVRRRGAHPERHRERMAATEVAHRGLHRMVASELDRLAEPALDEQVFGRRRGRIFRAERIGEHALVGAFVERVADDLSGNRARRLPGETFGHRARAGDPLSHALPHGRLAISQLGRLLAACFVGLGQRGGRAGVEEARLRRRHRRREEGVEPRLVDVVEEREQRIEVLLSERVEFVVVAAAAFERQAEKRRAKRGHTVIDVVDAILLFDRSALALLLVQAVEGRGEHLLVGRVRQQVASHLPECELVPRQVVVERLDHPVAPRPHIGPRPIELEAVAVGVAGEVHPVGRHPLAVAGAREQTVEQFFIRIGRGVGEEGLDLGGRRRQAGDVEARAADERGPVSLGLVGEAAVRKFLNHDRVDRMLRGSRFCDGRLHWRHECPMRLVLRPLGDPSLQRLDLLWREPANLRLRGRHDRVGIVRHDAGEQFAGVEVLRDDRPRAAVELGRGRLERVEPQASLAVGVVGAVAGEAVFRQDRPDVAVERKPCLLGGCRPGSGAGSTCNQARAEHHRNPWPSEERHASGLLTC